MIITIDGPTASGKSSAARMVAQRLGYYYLNSGLLYRALAYLLFFECRYSTLDSVAHPKDVDVIYLFEPDFLEYRWDGQAVRIIFRWIDITSNLKEPRIDQAASIVSTNSFVREKVNRRLRWLYREQGSCVVDGRDGGTKIFPDANLKIFLTASLEIRAERWRLDQEKRGNIFSLVEACDVLQERDSRDSQRAIAPLSIPEHAVVIDNGMLTEADTVEQIVALVYSCPSTLLR